MSTGFDSAPVGSPDSDRRSVRAVAGGFIVLLILAVLWPAPVVMINEEFLHQPLSVDDRSFLGREALSWDVVFIGLVGLYALVLMHGRLHRLPESCRFLVDEVRTLPQKLASECRRLAGVRLFAALIAFCLTIGWIWYLIDAPLIAAAESVQSPFSRSLVRLLNRLGGGMNVPMVIGFFLVAGMAFGRRAWLRVALAMALASLSGGIVVNLLKYLVGRSRPELWLGPFHHAGLSSNSFPSGHTVGAFAVAGVILLGSRSRLLKTVAFLLAMAIGASRVVAFRHWPSDVFTSSMIGMMFGWFFIRTISTDQDLSTGI